MPAWTVERPLAFAVGNAERVRIAVPGGGTTYLATGPRIALAPRTETERSITWFLDGRRIELDQDGCVSAGPGVHVLRAVEGQSGAADAVRFIVQAEY